MFQRGRRAVVRCGAGLLAAAASFAVACGNSDPNSAPLGGGVLFIGNSLTYANDLPGMVSALADSSGAGAIAASSVVHGGYSLGDHLAQGDAVEAIRRGGWSVVVLQQGPSSLDDSRADLLAQSALFASEIRAISAEPALYSVWPERARIGVFDRVTESYRLAAAHVHGLFLPAGAAWLAAWQRNQNLPLYSSDDFHPSAAGTYQAALVIYGRLSGRSTVGLPARLRTASGVVVNLPLADARVMQAAADEVNASFPARP